MTEPSPMPGGMCRCALEAPFEFKPDCPIHGAPSPVAAASLGQTEDPQTLVDLMERMLRDHDEEIHGGPLLKDFAYRNDAKYWAMTVEHWFANRATPTAPPLPSVAPMDLSDAIESMVDELDTPHPLLTHEIRAIVTRYLRAPKDGGLGTAPVVERVRTFLGAFTPSTYEGNYPPYLNVAQVGSMVRVTLRGSVKEDGTAGDTAVADLNVWNATAMASLFLEAVKGFDCHRPNWQEPDASTPTSPIESPPSTEEQP